MRSEGQRRSQKQERRVAKEHGGRVNPGSGNGDIHKNDVRTDTESWELKYTSKAQFPLKEADLNAAWVHSVIANKRMVFGIQFGNGDNYVVLNEDDYIELRDRGH